MSDDLRELLVDALCPPPCRESWVVSIVGQPTKFGPRTPCGKHSHLANHLESVLEPYIRQQVGAALEGAAQHLDVRAEEWREDALDPAEGQAVTLAEFLLARIAEDEYAVNHGNPGAMWRRLLTKCEAKRAIVAHHHPVTDGTHWGSLTGSACGVCAKLHADMGCEGEDWPCLTLRHLAMPYADHPDYDESWRPK